MRGFFQRLAVSVAVVCAGSGVGVGIAQAGGGATGSSPRVLGAGSLSLSASPLVVPTDAFLLGDQQEAAQANAERMSPFAVRARTASRTAFEHLGRIAAEKLAGGAFPDLVNTPAGGPPKLPAGTTARGFVTDNAETLDLPGGKHGVVESLAPIAREVSPGHRVALDLGLRENGGGFAPVNALVGLRIPKRIAGGVSLSESGVSLTPVDAHGAPLEGAQGVVDGASVFYGNTENASAGVRDVDTLVKPDTAGFSEETLLRSELSPSTLYFKVGLPAGGQLEQAQNGSRVVQVVADGKVLANIEPPWAADAEGTHIPVSMSVSGDFVKLAVDNAGMSIHYPVQVDPTIGDKEMILQQGSVPGNWIYTCYPTTFFCEPFALYVSTEVGKQTDSALNIRDHELAEHGKYVVNQYGLLDYPTQKESRIYDFTAKSVENNPSYVEHGVSFPYIEGTIYLASSTGKVEDPGEKLVKLPESGEHETSACIVVPGCTAVEVKGGENNDARFQASAITEGSAFFEDKLLGTSSVDIIQEKGPSASIDTSDATLNGLPNAAYPGTWVSTKPSSPAVIGVKAFDPGIGVYRQGLSSPNKTGWGFAPKNSLNQNGCEGVQCDECYESECTATKAHGKPLYLTLSEGGELPEGEDTIEAKVEDATGLSATASGSKIKVDNAPPHNITLSGLESGNELNSGPHKVVVSATDGSGSPSSGVASIKVALDGREVGQPQGSCAPGPCTTTGEWTLSTENYGIGQHTVTVTSTDNAGNVAVETFNLTVRSSSPVAAGPGTVDPVSGEFALTASDVSMGGGLIVSRSYGSRHLSAGAQTPFGPEWGLSLGGEESIAKQPNGNMVLTDVSGRLTTFTLNKEGKFESPQGDANLSLSEVETEKVRELVLSNAATSISTGFRVPSGGSGELWVPSIHKGTVPSETVTYAYETTEIEPSVTITRPTEALAPVPPGVSCSPKLEKGCRALTFKYATETTAKGETQSEWGEYKGRMAEVIANAYNPSSKAMTEMAIAKYSYDKQGRLRAEWDPRISPALKTIYSYDEEGHLVALTPPGQETWTLDYAPISTDPNAGRLMSVTLGGPGLPLWNGLAPSNTAVPTVSTTTPAEGTPISIASNGSWSNSPVSYSYQWENCWVSKCHVIPGATSASYTPTAAYANQKLIVRVTATNGGGSVSANSAETSAIKGIVPTYVTEFGKGTLTAKGTSEYAQYGGATAAAVDSSGNVWATNTTGTSTSVYVFNSSGTLQHTYSVSGVGTGIAINPTTNTVYVADAKNNKVWELNSKGEPIGSFALHKTASGKGWVTVTIDSAGHVWTSNHATSEIEEFASGGEFIKSFSVGVDEAAAVAVGNERVFVSRALFLEGKLFMGGVGEYTYSGGLFRDPIEAESGFNLAFEPDHGYIYTNKGTKTIYEHFPTNAKSQSESNCSGNCEGFPVAEFGAEKLTEPLDVAVDSANHYLYVVDHATGEIEKWTAPNPGNSAPAAPNPGTSSTTTLEYNVPVSGGGAPQQLGSKEVEAWGQIDDPVIATAIFPPDEPMGWPAKDYKRATVYYMDTKSRIVNVATPSGGISTTEYNANNDVERTLSADNRATALKEAKPAEAAKLLDTESTYNSEGTELLSSLGPRHLVKLTNGKEVQARNHTVYSYDEGAPSEGGPYRLVTKAVQEAQTETEGEQDARTTTTSYNGQNDLGWKLRKPTSVTADPAGLKITHTTLYNEQTGAVTEVKSPAALGGEVKPLYTSQFGSSGKENGQFSSPWDAAFDSSGNVWITDASNSRIEELSSSGTFIKAFGTAGTGEMQFSLPRGIAINQSAGDVYVVEEGNNRVQEFTTSGTFVRMFGKKGSGTGEFSSPDGLALDASGNVWVADYGNNRVEEFSSSGSYIAAYGTYGTGNGQFKSPSSVAIYGETVYVTDTLNNRVEELSLSGTYEGKFGSVGTGNGQLKEPEDIISDPVSGNLYVVDTANSRIQKFTPGGVFVTTFGSFGSGTEQMSWPRGVAINASDEDYVIDSGNNRVEKWVLPNLGAHDEKMVYYTAGTEASVASCQKHPEWTNLLCQTEPAEQPGGGLPALPVTKVTSYNVWDEPEVTTSTSGTSTRTTTVTYDNAGRGLTSETTSTVDKALPKVTNKYSETTGAPVEQSATVEGKNQSIRDVFNNLGQMTSYTDASGNTTTYEYEPEKDTRLTKINDGDGTQTYAYDETTGTLNEVNDSAAGKFTAGHDIEGNLTSQTYPNGMTATYTFNTAGEETGLVYKKEAKEWFSDSVVPSIHGQWLNQTSSLGKDAYTYDQVGRLTETQTTPTGKGCVTRRYAYDEDTNRKSLTTYQPNASNECSTTSGNTVEKHTYDLADRLTDTGATYDPFGNTEKVPAADAGGSELLSTFYVNNEVYSLEQNGQTIDYSLDPVGRANEIISTGKIVATETLHYAGPGNSPDWTSETSGKTTRNITGITGLEAIQHGTETPILQIANLHGDVVATAADSESSKELASTIAEPTEYGVPATETPPKYSWLGSHELPTELPSGVMTMGVRSYVPQLGRFLQTDPIPGGSANAYAYTYGDPINSSDPSGAYTASEAVSYEALSTAGNIANAGAEEAQAAKESAARAEAERNAEEADAAAAAYAAWYTGAGEEWGEEEWEEEEGEEYTSYHHGAKGEWASGQQSLEGGLLYQPLEGEDAERTASKEQLVALCKQEMDGRVAPSADGGCARYVGGHGAIPCKKCHHVMGHHGSVSVPAFVESVWKWLGEKLKGEIKEYMGVARYVINLRSEAEKKGAVYSKGAASTCEVGAFAVKYLGASTSTKFLFSVDGWIVKGLC